MERKAELVGGETEFQRRVFQALREVPCGYVVSYGSLAQRVGIRSAQAVGQALKKNLHAPVVPCHRVIRQDGHLGGYFGAVGSEEGEKKRSILASEGVTFTEAGYLEQESKWWHWGAE